MAIMNTNLIRPTLSGLDNLNTNNSLDAGGLVGYNNLSSISQPTNPAEIGVRNIFMNNNILNNQTEETNKALELQENIQSLSKSVNTQEARIAAGTGTDIANQYLEDEEEKDEGLLTKIFHILDAPRNALFNGFNYVAQGISGGFFEGFWQGLTYQEEYSGYDLAEDMGLEGAPKTIVGFASEVFLDPLNWITWGFGAFAKGFGQGAVKNVAKETAEQTARTGVRELGEQALKEGGELASNELVSSGIKNIDKQVAKQAGQELSEKAAIQTVKQVNSGAGGLLNKLSNKLNAIENEFGLTFGNAKLQAAYRQAINEASSTGRLAGGLTDDVLDLARAGNYGDEIAEMAENFVKTKQARVGIDDALGESLDAEIKQMSKDLLERLEPYKLQLRYDALNLKGVDANSLRNGISSMYEDTMAGSLKLMENQYNVNSVDDLIDALSIRVGKQVTERDLYTLMVQKGFGERVTAQLSDNLLKYGNIDEVRTKILDTLIDNVAADQIYEKALQNGMKQLGTGLGFNVPFTNITKDIADVNQMFELGAKARAIISTKITSKGLEPTVAGRVLDSIGNGIGAVFGHLPILGSALSETNRLEKTNRWAIKFIEQSTKGAAKQAGIAAENSIEQYYKILKEAGFDNADDINDVGNFVSRAIESKQLSKTGTIEDWKKTILGFSEMDDVTINNRVNEELARIEEQYANNPQLIDDVFGDEGFDYFYNKTKTGLASDLKNQSDLKSILASYDEKKQNAILEVTKGIAEDFDGIGRTLAELKLIPDNRMLEAEYWYFPHKMSLDLMLENNMDIDRTIGSIRTTAEAADELATGGIGRQYRQVISGKTERFTIKNVSSWQRKYPMSTVEVNKILKEKYGVDHMLETNAFNTYLLYALDQGKVIADANEVNDVLNSFGFKVRSKDLVPYLRSHGYTIVTRNSNVDAMLVSDKAFNAMQSYNDRAKQLNELYKKVKGAGRNIETAQRQAGVTLREIAEETRLRSEIKDTLESTAKETKARAKELVTDSNYIRDILNKKGILPEGLDEDTFYDMLDSIVNNEYMRGNNIYMTDSLGYQTMPELMATNKLRNADGKPQLFLGTEDIQAGFRLVPQEIDTVSPAQDYFYIVSNNPFDIQVADLADELNMAKLKYTDDMKQEYLLKGYDSFRLTDSTGATAVIPFDESNIFYKNKTKQAEFAGKYKFASDMANTTKGGFVNPKKAFTPDDTPINVKNIPASKRKALANLIDSDYIKINTAQAERNKILKDVTSANNKNSDTVLKLMNKREELYTQYEKLNPQYDVVEFNKLSTQINNINKTIARLQGTGDTYNSLQKSITKRINNVETSKAYNFVEALKKGKGYATTADATVTQQELYNMLGRNKEAGLVLLGYDAVVDHVDDVGKTIYRALPNATQMTKQDLVDMFDVNMALINSDIQARTLVELLTDNGTGRDSLAKVVEEYANPNLRSSLSKMKTRLQRVMDVNAERIKELDQVVVPKQLTKGQANTIARMASSDNFLTAFRDDASVDDLFNISETIAALTKEDTDIWALPTEIVDYFNKGVRSQTDKGAALLKDIMWKFNKIWKPSVTAWRPSFGVRNLMSGYFNSFMYAGTHIFDPDITSTAIKLLSGKNMDEVVELGGKKLTLKEIKEQMVKTGATNGLVVTDVSTIGNMLADQLKKATDPSYVSPIKHPLKSLEKLNAGVEDYNRSLLYLAALKNGESFEYAGDLVKQLQFDYADLSEFEKKIKTIMPFYTWMRNNIPLQIERFMDDPRLYMILMKRVPDAGKEASDMTDEEWNNMPDWIKDTFPIALGKDQETGRYRLFDTTLPYQDLAKLGDTQGMFGEVVSLLHPLIKTPIELFLNKNLYTNAALESYEGETAEKAIQGTANPVLNAIAKVAPNALRNMPRCYCNS